MERAREIARRIQAGERVAMKRWLRERCSWCKFVHTIDELSEEVRNFGGDPEKLRAEGKKRVKTLLYMEVQR